MWVRVIATLAAALIGAGAAGADAPQVATDITPVHSLVARVMRGAGSPALIVAPGASPHGYAMRPSDAAALDAADIVIWVGPELTPWLEDAIDALAGDAQSLALLDAPGTRRLPLRDGATFAAHAHGAARHAGHGHAGPDPHAWLDPANARSWVARIADELSDLDPANAALYARNADAARAEIAALQAGIADRLAPVSEVPFLVFHDAYQYFEARFDVDAAGAISRGDANAPSAARIAALRDLVQARDIACILTEPQFDPGLVETVFGGVARRGVVDPLALGVAPGPDLYPDLLRDMAAALRDCLGGAG